MTSRRYSILFVCTLAAFPWSALAEQYLCAADLAIGFAYSETTKSWGEASFKADSKYIVSQPENSGGEFAVKELGSSFNIATCKSGFNSAGFLLCSGLGGEFKLNKFNGRYILSYMFGYFNVVPERNKITDEESDTPYIEIGKCSRF